MKTHPDKDLLRSINLSVTNARLGLLEILRANSKPLDVATLVGELKKRKIFVDTATVYRTLEAFSANRVVAKLELGEGKFRYELMRGDHHHMICERCGTIEDIEDCPIDATVVRIGRTHKFRVTRHSFELFGLCSSCQGTYA